MNGCYGIKQLNRNMKGKALSIFVITCAVLYIFVSVLNLIDLNENYLDYKNLYGFTSSSDHWQFRSVRNLRISIYIDILIAASIILLNIAYIYKKSKALYIIKIVFEGAILLMIIRYFILWYMSGFDHYPGFDPYIM